MTTAGRVDVLDRMTIDGRQTWLDRVAQNYTTGTLPTPAVVYDVSALVLSSGAAVAS